MAELREALELLGHIGWEDVPQDGLAGFLTPLFTAGELLVNSVPLPPNGTPFGSARPHFSTPNTAKSVKDVYPSPARPQHPFDEHEKLRKNWGKPMKFGQKENPLNVALYKMAGHDRHGAWFARHNVLEGIGYSKFKKAMQREFPETLLTQGAPGAGAIRGLSAERRVERIDVKDVGRVEVYQLSAQMPSPVTPREFLTLFLSTDQALCEKSPSPDHGGEKYVPRHLMVVSKALHHSEVPERSTFVRGSYESVELMREIPLHLANQTDPELNPIEWIMVTRSDPAGGIPRFLIDRGTPGAMLEDVSKFLNWACSHEEIPDPDADVEKQQQVSEEARQELERDDESQLAQATQNLRRRSTARADNTTENVSRSTTAELDMANGASTTDGAEESSPETPVPVTAIERQPGDTGILSTLGATLEAGVTSYAPVPVSNFVKRQLHPEQATAKDQSDSDSDSDSSSSYMSANEMKRLSTAPEYIPGENTPPDPMESFSVATGGSAASSLQSSNVDKKNLSSHDKEVLRIMQRREKLDEKLAKKRREEEAKFQQSQEKEQTGQDKAKERLDKEIKKTEERHKKEVEKLEAKREKELRKAEERRKKKEDSNRLSLVARERDDLRSQANLLRTENGLLSDQVEALQRENTALARLVGKLGGPDALKNVQEEVKKAGGSIKSSDSHLTLQSSGSSEKR